MEPSRAGRVVRRILIFHFVAFCWIFFRADSFGSAAHVIGRVFTGWGVPSPNVTVALVGLIFAGIAMQYVPKAMTESIQTGFSRLALPLQGVACALGLFMVSTLGAQGPSLFLYFRF